jgi:hypothetical protein
VVYAQDQKYEFEEVYRDKVKKRNSAKTSMIKDSRNKGYLEDNYNKDTFGF